MPAGQFLGQNLHSVSCPSTTQCTAVDDTGQEVTYNPQTGNRINLQTIDVLNPLESVSCPGTAQCVAVDLDGQVLVFDPTNPSSVDVQAVDTSGGFLSITCPAADQCTASDLVHRLVTFDPGTPDSRATISPTSVITIDNTSTSDEYFVSCGAADSCSAVDVNGHEASFNPQGAGSSVTSVSLDAQPLLGVSCSSGAQCVAVDDVGQGVEFNPQSVGSPTPVSIDAGRILFAVDCTSDQQCDAADADGGVVTFAPTGSPNATRLGADGSQTLNAIACPATGECTVVDGDGQESTVSPGSGVAGSPQSIDTGLPLIALDCPTAQKCVTVDKSGHELTFDPGSPGPPTATGIDAGDISDSVACPQPGQCVAADFQGNAINFDPGATTPPSGASVLADAAVDANEGDLGIACPSSTQCTAVDAGGGEVTFDPASPPSTAPTPTAIDTHQLNAVACPTSILCVAVDNDGNEITFDPTSTTSPSSETVDSGESLNGIACPTVNQCTAVDSIGGEVTFRPGTQTQPLFTPIDSGHVLDGIACASTSDCVAVDANGRGVEGDPSDSAQWVVEPISGATRLSAVSCPSATECIAVDSLGREATATIPVPANISPPTITGQAVPGQTLTETHGSWTNAPGAYTYQWLRCDDSGDNCATVPGATAQTFTVTTEDIGHTLAAQETAANTGGTSAPATSATTGVVVAPPIPGRPAVVSESVSTVTATSVTISGVFVPDGLATTAHFEYGFDSKYYGGGAIRYSEQTAPVPSAADYSPHTVSVTISGLVPNATYHFHLVADNADGSTVGPDSSFVTALAPAPAPLLARTVNVTPVNGLVLIKPPHGKSFTVHGKKISTPLTVGHGFTPLTQPRQLPMGSQIDARRGTLRLVSALGSHHRVQTVTFGKGLFTTTQTRTGLKKGLTTATLVEGAYAGAPSYKSCAMQGSGEVRGLAPAATAKRPRTLSNKVLQTLHASDHGGHFATHGRYAAGTTRGTAWTTTDRCDGTVISVQRGAVSVTNLRTRKVVLVHAGHRYFAHA